MTRMSEPKRYWMDDQNDADFPYEAVDGEWVKYEDYASLKAEVERLTADIKVYKEGVMKSDNLFQSIGIFVKDEEWVSDGITQLIERANKAEADVERLTALNKKIMATADVIDANNQRLTKAGDCLVIHIEACYRAEGYDPKDCDMIDNWNAAKEGKQS